LQIVPANRAPAKPNYLQLVLPNPPKPNLPNLPNPPKPNLPNPKPGPT